MYTSRNHEIIKTNIKNLHTRYRKNFSKRTGVSLRNYLNSTTRKDLPRHDSYRFMSEDTSHFIKKRKKVFQKLADFLVLNNRKRYRVLPSYLLISSLFVGQLQKAVASERFYHSTDTNVSWNFFGPVSVA